MPSSPGTARSRCAQKRTLLLDSLAKAKIVKAQVQERAAMLLAGSATLDLLEAVDEQIVIARREHAEVLQCYMDHCKEHGC